MYSRSFYKIVIVLPILATLSSNLVMVAFLHRFFYGSLEVEKPASLHRLASSLGTHGRLAHKDYLEIVDGSDAFDAVAAVKLVRGQAVYIDGQPDWISVAWTSGTCPQVVGPEPMAGGRFFSEAEDRPGAGKVAVASESTWRRISGGAPFVAGKTLVTRGVAFEIVGVARNEYPRLDSLSDVDVWIPARQNPAQWQFETDDYQVYQVLARLDQTPTLHSDARVERTKPQGAC